MYRFLPLSPPLRLTQDWLSAASWHNQLVLRAAAILPLTNASAHSWLRRSVFLQWLALILISTFFATMWSSLQRPCLFACAKQRAKLSRPRKSASAFQSEGFLDYPSSSAYGNESSSCPSTTLAAQCRQTYPFGALRATRPPGPALQLSWTAGSIPRALFSMCARRTERNGHRTASARVRLPPHMRLACP